MAGGFAVDWFSIDWRRFGGFVLLRAIVRGLSWM
jgi:hypothetical protein